MEKKKQILTTVGLFIILVAIISVVIGVYFWPKNKDEGGGRIYVELKDNVQETYKRLVFDGGETLQEILDRNYDTGYLSPGFISKIDWLEAIPPVYIVYTVNDKSINDGVADYKPVNLDIITFTIIEYIG